jgi:hypothetical protein
MAERSPEISIRHGRGRPNTVKGTPSELHGLEKKGIMAITKTVVNPWLFLVYLFASVVSNK